ncbi:hypothetical protein H7F50_05970 [Novosphingobium flavum]|uniref:hypothetical protein n=1 Tax=Novosphingobium aerophilum TaxID=2839843 RepID=UPI00163A0388|nr:hypothetical protein [Novosphingobium aerophilum]MBC2661295.1 hypothetical protein [Novosphingobium aerophilum]
MRKLALLCSTLLLTAPQVAAAQDTAPCLTAPEVSSLLTYALPSVIDGISRTCATRLPDSAYLRRSGTEMSQRYTVAKTKAWPVAKAAFVKMSSGKDQTAGKVLMSMPDDTLQKFVDAAFAGIVTGEIKPESCGTIDRLMSAIAPLPPENTSELLSVLIGLGSRSGAGRMGPISFCKA